MLPSPLFVRRNIPFFTSKSEADFRADPYERYDEQVTRQMTLHYGFPEAYEWQTLEDWVFNKVEVKQQPFNLLEIGCGVGRLIGTIAERWPGINCYGFDYSYQMLKVADDYWRSSKALNWRHPGFEANFHLPARPSLSNLQLGLAAAEKLPFPDQSLDVVINSFLIDRLSQPELAPKEWRRVLKPGGILLSISPLNFQAPAHWEQFYPLEKLLRHYRHSGFSLLGQPEALLLRQSIDQHGNAICWNTKVWRLQKTI